MSKKLKEILNNLQNPFILLSTLTNIWVLLETLDFLNFCGITKETYMKVVGVIIFILIQIGILTRPKSPLNLPTNTEEIDTFENTNNFKY